MGSLPGSPEPDAPVPAGEAPSPPRSRPKSSLPPPTGAADQDLPTRLNLTLESFRTERLALPVVGSVVSSIFGLMENDSAEVDEVVAVVSQDPTFSAEVLRRSNTGEFSMGRELTSLRDSCIALGSRGVVAVAQTVVLERLQHVKTLKLQEPGHRMWRCSQVTAAVVRRMAIDLEYDAAEAYVSALMHNVGELLILHALSEIAETGAVVASSPASVAAICRSVHEQVGGRFLRSWQAPTVVQQIAADHHGLPPGRPAPRRPLRRLVVAGWKAAIAAGCGYFPEHEGATLPKMAPELSSKTGELLMRYAQESIARLR